MNSLSIDEIVQVEKAIEGRSCYLTSLFLEYPQTPSDFAYGIQNIQALKTAKKTCLIIGADNERA